MVDRAKSLIIVDLGEKVSNMAILLAIHLSKHRRESHFSVMASIALGREGAVDRTCKNKKCCR